jgi:hypothetical protein
MRARSNEKYGDPPARKILLICQTLINGEEDVKAGLLGKVQELAVLFAGKAGLQYRYAYIGRDD